MCPLVFLTLLSQLCGTTWGECPTILINSGMNNPGVTASNNSLVGWTRRNTYTTLTTCKAWNTARGGVLSVRGSSYTYHPAVYQNVTVVPGQTYTWSCDLYDYDYAQLDAVNGSDPMGTSFPGFPVKVPNGGWRTLTKNFTAISSNAIVTVFGTRVCARNCSLIPQICEAQVSNASKPTVWVVGILRDTILVNVTSNNTSPYTTRCVATESAVVESSTFWALPLSAQVREVSSLPATVSFTGLKTNTNFTIGCACSNNASLSEIISLSAVTLATCQDINRCSPDTKCIDPVNGTATICAPYLDGVFLTASPRPCRHLGGPSGLNLTTTVGGENITVCLVVGNNTNASSFPSSIQLSYGMGSTFVPCVNLVFSAVSDGYLTATCRTSAGVGQNLNLSLTFNSSATGGSVQVPSPDFLSYPLPVIFPNTSRFFDQPGAWTNALISPTSDAVKIAFSVANVVPESPLLRVYYGPTTLPRQRECTLSREESNSSTIVCLTAATTTYSPTPYQWTVAVGDASVRGTDTFNLLATFPRIIGVNATGCAVGSSGVFACPPLGSVPGAPVTLTVFGENFGSSPTNLRVVIDGAACALLFRSSDTVMCSLPAGAGFNRSVFVQVGDQYSAPAPLVSYKPPTITGLCGCGTSCPQLTLALSDCPRAGNATLEIYGTSFGLQGATVLVGSSTCDAVQHDALSPDTHLSCTLKPGFSVHSSVIVLQRSGENSASGLAAELSFASCPPGTFESGGTQCTDCAPGTFAPLAGQQECLVCVPGSVSSLARQTACRNCGIGKYQDLSNQTDCRNCTSGTFSGSYGLVLCTDCAAGTYANSTGATACIACDKGSVSTSIGATVCTLCETGTFSATPGQPACDSCYEGSTSNISGATTCERCGKGSFIASAGQSMCKLCAVGRFAESTGSYQCSTCAPGKYAQSEGQSSCENCMNGYAQPVPGGTSCDRCSPGTFSIDPWSNCTLCAAGKQSVPDNSGCDACDPGTYQNAVGQSSCALCALGTFLDIRGGTACLSCAADMVALQPGMSQCTPCPQNSAPYGVPPTCLCLPTFYMAANKSCIPCDLGMECRVAGLEEVKLMPTSGYVKVLNVTMFVRCLVPSYCPGDQLSCAPHRNGALCQTCEPGYRPVQGDAACSLCPTSQAASGYVVGIGLLILLGLTLLYLFILRTDMNLFDQKEPVRKKWWEESDKEDSAEQRPRLSTVAPEPDQGPVVGMRMDSRIKKTLSYQFKIFITFLQLATALLSLTDVNWPPSFQSFASGFDFVNFVLPWGYVGCISQLDLFDKILLTCFIPPIFLVIIAGPLWLLLKALEKRGGLNDPEAKRAKSKSMFQRVIVFTTFLCYPAISRQIIAYFRCVGVPDGQTITYYLLESFSEQCYDEVWLQRLAPVIIALLVYPIGIPLVSLLVLIRHRSRFKEPHTMYSLGLVYSGFHIDYWWFGILDMCHKLTLTSLVGLFALKQDQILSALVIAALYLVTLVLTMPYLCELDNLFHILSQMEIFLLVLSMQCGETLSATPSGSTTDVLVSGVLVVVVLAVIASLVVLIVKYLRLEYRRKSMEKQRKLSRLETVTETTSASA